MIYRFIVVPMIIGWHAVDSFYASVNYQLMLKQLKMVEMIKTIR